ncbi:major facilitator superfamily domain-containing protein [Cercophora samala]|uniref:Major facilitator superfamily domain-containing protein n=1 Tax=Cercophora samala TaxID=330535 RepID=A0AA39YJE6_9PEZI|nr:major facilitator superfamily domain-containing protein [Cercophora samala]
MNNTGQEPGPPAPAPAVLDITPAPIPDASQTSTADSSSPNEDDPEKQTPIITTTPINPTPTIHPDVNHYRIAALSLASFTAGLTDASVGPLIEPMKHFHNLPDDKLISLLWVAQAVGFILGAALLSPLRSLKPFLNHDNVTLLSANMLVFLSYLPFVCSAPLPAVILAFLPLGLGNSFNIAIGNVYCGSLRRKSTFYLGVVHACYGLGATVGPLIATGMIVQTRLDYGKFYSIPLCLSFINSMLLFWAFREYPVVAAAEGAVVVVAGRGAGATTTAAAATERKNTMTPGGWIKSHLPTDTKLVIFAALFMFCYQGAEVSNAGWTTEYLHERYPASQEKMDTYGYTMTGFWAGVTLGRVLLTPLGESWPAMGNKGFVYFLVLLCAIFQLVLWFLRRNLAASGAAVALIGFFIGPGYPCAMEVVMNMVDGNEVRRPPLGRRSREAKAAAVGVISAFGMTGGAAVPFIIGNLNGPVGRWVLHPIVLGLYALMLIIWFLLPEPEWIRDRWQPRSIHRFIRALTTIWD